MYRSVNGDGPSGCMSELMHSGRHANNNTPSFAPAGLYSVTTTHNICSSNTWQMLTHGAVIKVQKLAKTCVEQNRIEDVTVLMVH